MSKRLHGACTTSVRWLSVTLKTSGSKGIKNTAHTTLRWRLLPGGWVAAHGRSSCGFNAPGPQAVDLEFPPIALVGPLLGTSARSSIQACGAGEPNSVPGPARYRCAAY